MGGKIERARDGGRVLHLRIKSAGGSVMTTGQVADYCGVASRTVSKWFDSGRLKGYRIPGSQDRRIPVKSLFKFLSDHNMPIGDDLRNLVNPKKVVVTYGLPESVMPPAQTPTLDIVRVESIWDLGLRVASPLSAGVVVIGCSVPKSEVQMLLARVRGHNWLSAYCHGPDQWPGMFPDADLVIDGGKPPADIAAAVMSLLHEEDSYAD
jgi:excisionase family DNA binding protein